MLASNFVSSPPVLFAVGLSMVFLASLPIVRRSPGLASWIALGYVAKLCGSAANYWLTLGAYGSLQDVELYHRGGLVASDAISKGDLWPELSASVVIPGSTANVARLVGWWYFYAGDSIAWAYFAWATIGFLGSLAFLRAGQLVAGEGSRQFALLILFFPSIIFYPSIVGKDAFVFLGLGLVTVAVAKSILGSRGLLGAFVPAGSGFVILGVIRPHIAGILLVAIAATALSARRLKTDPLIRLLGGMGLLILTYYVVRLQAAVVAPSDAVALLTSTANNSSIGGSAFENRSVESPIRFIVGLVTVMFRPWLFEARSIPQIFAALEGLFMLGYTLLAISRWRIIAAAVKRSAFMRFAAFAIVGLMVLLVAISNFGLLARQRTQAFPFLFALLALEMIVAGKRAPSLDALTERQQRAVDGSLPKTGVS